MKKKPVLLMILDGWGIAPPSPYNAATLAKTPNLTELFKEWPHGELTCSGEVVGLPDGQMGNSEVGHMNIGAGRIVYQELTNISHMIADGEFYANPVLQAVMKRTREKQSKLHLLGLFSDGGVHSHIEHLFALMEMAKREKLPQVYLHLFLDGRDVGPETAVTYLQELQQKIVALGIGEIVTVSGRYYAMDRDKRWPRVQKAYDAICGRGTKFVADPVAAVEESYAQGVTDEFVEPVVVKAAAGDTVQADDSIIFFNFRPDRARQLTRALVDPDFTAFARPFVLNPENYVCMTEYDKTINAEVAFPPQRLEDTFGEVVSAAGLRQLRIAETEKYAHVTFFFNGGVEVPNCGEDRILIPSPQVATYDLKPEMSAYEVKDRLLQALSEDIYDAVILNLANPDMVGHSGIVSAAVRAMEVVDDVAGQIVKAVTALGGVICITADHGNLEKMEDPETHQPCTSHTTNKVPFLVVGDKSVVGVRDGILADIAPTLLALLHLQRPAAMTGKSLLIKKKPGGC